MAEISELTIEHCKKHAAKQCSTCPLVGFFCTLKTTSYPSAAYDEWIEKMNKSVESLYKSDV